MKNRKLGNSNLTISAVGFGCMGLSHAFGTPLEKSEAADRIKNAYEIGYTLFDTAECYTGTNLDGTIAYNEEAVGDGIKGIRDKIILATKCGVRHMGDHLEMDSRPETIRNSLEGSLKRLKTDYIDLYYQHRVDPNVEPEVVAETMGQLLREGKIRSWGISAVSEEYLRRAHAVTPVSAVENMYSLIDRGSEALFPTLEELGITMVAYTPLAKGFLSGSYIQSSQFDHPEDNRSGRYQFSEEGIHYYQAVLELIRSIADEKSATMAQIALAWMMNKKDWIVPIPGTRNASRMQENADSTNIILNSDDVQKIDAALDQMNLTDTANKRIH